MCGTISWRGSSQARTGLSRSEGRFLSSCSGQTRHSAEWNLLAYPPAQSSASCAHSAYPAPAWRSPPLSSFSQGQEIPTDEVQTTSAGSISESLRPSSLVSFALTPAFAPLKQQILEADCLVARESLVLCCFLFEQWQSFSELSFPSSASLSVTTLPSDHQTPYSHPTSSLGQSASSYWRSQ